MMLATSSPPLRMIVPVGELLPVGFTVVLAGEILTAATEADEIRSIRVKKRQAILAVSFTCDFLIAVHPHFELNQPCSYHNKCLYIFQVYRADIKPVLKRY
jgi:hypothetical protein